VGLRFLFFLSGRIVCGNLCLVCSEKTSQILSGLCLEIVARLAVRSGKHRLCRYTVVASMIMVPVL
jgi:hypothetical protein